MAATSWLLLGLIGCWGLASVEGTNPPTLSAIAGVILPEDTAVDTLLATCSMTDTDSGSSGIVFALIAGGNVKKRFAVVANTCEIYLVRPFDFEDTTTYNVQIQAKDMDGNTSLIRTFVVTVTDVNDNAPSCTDHLIVNELSETSSVGTIIGTFTCTDPDTGAGGTIEYVAVSGDTAEIDIDINTGQATLRTTIDYDSTTQYRYSVVVDIRDTDGSNPLTSNGTVFFILADADDITPSFGTTFSTSVNENIAVGSSLIQVAATDGDSVGSTNSDITYAIVTSSQNWLTIDTKTGIIYNSHEMDRETATTVTATVSAYSGTNTGSTDTTSVTITLNDVNDNIPSYSTTYRGSVDENAVATTQIMDSVPSPIFVTATDADSTSVIVYSTTSTDFDVDSANGAITVAVAPNYETDTAVLMKVVASDGTFSSTATIQIIINPVNEFSPSFGTPVAFTVGEDEDPGNILGATSPSLTVTDADDGVDGDILYSLVNPGSVPFAIDQDTGNLRVSEPLDYETATSYTFDVRATDQSGTAQRSTDQLITVTVTNVDDEDPVCTAISTHVIPDATSINNVVGTISCTDPDDATTPTFSYDLAFTPSDSTFTMSSNLVQMQSIPLATQYNITVTVTDGGNQTTDVVFEVLTETLFTLTAVPTSVTVLENTVADLSTVLTWGSIFPYAILGIDSGNTDKHIVLYSTSGGLQLVSPYDYEAGVTSYIYSLRAVSTFGQEALVDVNVTVTDVNDNTPAFGSGLYTLTIVEKTAAGTMTTYLATDSDSNTAGPYGTVTHAISSGSGIFSINATTGELSQDGSLDYDVATSHTLVLIGYDGGIPSLTGTTTVVVTVQQADENVPTITSTAMTILKAENSAIGGSLVRVQAADADTGITFTYSFASGNTDWDFLIDNVTGIVYVAHLLDRERTASYTLVTQATDQNGVVTQITLTVTVTDENDNDPVWGSDVYEFYVPHGTTSGTSVGTVAVTDADDPSTNNGLMDESIVTSTLPLGEFTLSLLTVTTNTAMDYTTKTKYTFKIISVDRASPARTGTAMVVVHVSPDVTQPSFSSSNGTVSITEGTTAGTQVIDLDATVLGASETDNTMAYSLTSVTPSNDFIIRSDTGEVVVSSSLDYESYQSYSVSVLACYTTACIANRDTFSLTINIINENDNRPVFVTESFSFEVEETANVGDMVSTAVVATDADFTTFNGITYTMTGASTDFTIVSSSGQINVAASLDYTTKNVYNYVVTATDDGSPAKSTQVSVVIRVKDSNTNDPVFTSATTISIEDSAPIGSDVFHFHATDVDTGVAGTLTYGIVSDTSAGKFSLDSSSGILTTVGLLDAAVNPSYSMQVRVDDGGTPVRTALTTLAITVVSTVPNNNSPVFAVSPATAPVSRTDAAGTLVYTAVATDSDNGDAGVVTHKILSGNTAGYFLIDSSSGAITTATSFTLAADTYNMVILAVDSGIPQKSATLSLGVTVTPSLTTSTTFDYSFTVAEDATTSTEVGRIDVDAGRTATAYAITIGNHGTAFSVAIDNGDGGRGVISTAATLDYEAFPLYALQVQVTIDIGTMNKYIKIDVTDVNDNAPAFASSNLALTIGEGLPVGTTVETISYTDADTAAASRDNTLEMQSPGSTLFSLDASGNLIVSSVPDYETTSSLSFEIHVKENISPFTTATMTVDVTVLDIPEVVDKYPSDITTTAMISLELPYQSSNGHVLHTMSVGDCGITAGAGATVEYLSYFNTGPFSVGSSSGEISVSDDSLLTPATKYVRWMVCRSTETTGAVTSRVVVLRIDTFDRDTEMIVLDFSNTAAQVASNIVLFRQMCQVLFTSTQRFGTAQAIETTTSARRRLLATTTAVYGYGVNDTSVDQIENIDNSKTFMTEAELLALLQRNADGTPMNGLDDSPLLTLSTVNPYDESSSDDETFWESAAGIAVICVMCVFFVTLIAAVSFGIYTQRLKSAEGILHVRPA